MDFTFWDVMLGTISWSIRLLFWPLGFVIKYREFFVTFLPCLFVGLVALNVVLMALRLIGRVVRGVFAVTCRLVWLSRVAAARPSRRSEKAAETLTAVTEGAEGPDDPYWILGVGRWA